MVYRQEQEELQPSRTLGPVNTGERLSSQRQFLAASLKDIESNVRTALDNAGLAVEVFFAIPSRGEALLALATPADPSDPDWPRANQIVCDIVGEIVGIEGLYSRPITCSALDNAVSIDEFLAARLSSRTC